MGEAAPRTRSEPRARDRFRHRFVEIGWPATRPSVEHGTSVSPIHGMLNRRVGQAVEMINGTSNRLGSLALMEKSEEQALDLVAARKSDVDHLVESTPDR